MKTKREMEVLDSIYRKTYAAITLVLDEDLSSIHPNIIDRLQDAKTQLEETYLLVCYPNKLNK